MFRSLNGELNCDIDGDPLDGDADDTADEVVEVD